MDLMNYKPIGKINKKDLLTLMDYSREEIYELLHMAIKLKKEYKQGIKHTMLNGKTLALIFAKSSTRTRVSFEMGMRQLGGDTLYLSQSEMQLGRGETVHDTAKVISRMGLSGIMIRTFDQSDVEGLAKYGSIPVINGLTDLVHPCQALADVLTIYECLGKIEGTKLAYLGDGNNVTHSLMIIGAKLGMEVACVCPKGYEPDSQILNYCNSLPNSNVYVTDNIPQGVKNADVLYTDVFFSMGQEKSDSKLNALMPYQINNRIINWTGKEPIVMHCLPAHRGEEISAEVMDGKHSVVFDEAENRLHAQKAVLYMLLGD